MASNSCKKCLKEKTNLKANLESMSSYSNLQHLYKQKQLRACYLTAPSNLTIKIKQSKSLEKKNKNKNRMISTN